MLGFNGQFISTYKCKETGELIRAYQTQCKEYHVPMEVVKGDWVAWEVDGGSLKVYSNDKFHLLFSKIEEV